MQMNTTVSKLPDLTNNPLTTHKYTEIISCCVSKLQVIIEMCHDTVI